MIKIKIKIRNEGLESTLNLDSREFQVLYYAVRHTDIKYLNNISIDTKEVHDLIRKLSEIKYL
jgi:hypothetical protein